MGMYSSPEPLFLSLQAQPQAEPSELVHKALAAWGTTAG